MGPGCCDSINCKIYNKMGLNCGCPQSAALSSIPISECKESFGQIQKVIFQRIYKTSGAKNSIAAAGATKKTTYTALLTAADGTKIVVSPYLQNPTVEPGAARTFGGGNQTLNGIEIIIGREPTTFTGTIYQERAATIAAMKKLMCENVGVYLVDENGNIGCLADGSTATSYYPIPLSKLFIGDKKFGGFEEPDSNTVEWSFLPNWSDAFAIIKGADLDFNPLTDLVNSTSDSDGLE